MKQISLLNCDIFLQIEMNNRFKKLLGLKQINKISYSMPLLIKSKKVDKKINLEARSNVSAKEND